MKRRLGAVGALVFVVSAFVAAGAWAGAAQAQDLPPLTTPPIDIGVPGLVDVHVDSVQLVGSDTTDPLLEAPSLPGTSSDPLSPVTGSSTGSTSGGTTSSPPAAPAGSSPAGGAGAPASELAPSSSTPPPTSTAGTDATSSQAASRALEAASRDRSTSPSIGSAIARAVTEPRTLVGAVTLALGFGVVVGAAPYLPRYRRRQRELLDQWARASERAHTVAASFAEADEQKSEFLALVSHELRTPLTAVKGFVDTVLLHWEGLTGDRRRGLLTRASSNADELGRLVGQLIEFGRTESGTIKIAPETIGVAAAVEVALGGIAPVTADHHIDVDIPDTLAVNADPDAFNHVLVNLLTNAVKYSPKGSTVAIRARRDENEVVVSVADEGAGIAPDEQERIFDRFYQSQNGSHARGTGIGLTIAQRFTAQHGGRIWVESEPDHGATFSFTMPAVDVMTSPAARGAPLCAAG